MPTLPIVPEGFIAKLKNFAGSVVIGPRSGSKTDSFCIPAALAPGDVSELIPLKVTRVESLRDGVEERGELFSATRWIEDIETELEPEFATQQGRGVVYRHGNIRYVATWPDSTLLANLIARVAEQHELWLGLPPFGVRFRSTVSHIFAFNYNAEAVDISQHWREHERIIGEDSLPPAGVAIWKRS